MMHQLDWCTCTTACTVLKKFLAYHWQNVAEAKSTVRLGKLKGAKVTRNNAMPALFGLRQPPALFLVL